MKLKPQRTGIMIILGLVLSCCTGSAELTIANQPITYQEIVAIDSAFIIEKADQYLNEEPVPITTHYCERSMGGRNDFYSEGDYWWPDSANPAGPYVRRDGMTNPENFTDHRKSMRRMSIHVATLTAAFKITGEKKYAQRALAHLRAWFIDSATKMSPHMEYAQAIKGIVPGRGVGLIDGIHLVEPARAVSVLKKYAGISDEDYNSINVWFQDFLAWMTTHEYGIDERDRENNHGTCWVMQAAEFARLTNNEEILKYCRNRYKNVLLPNQMAEDGSFPMELDRTKPYGYSLFNIDAMAMVCQILSIPSDNLWQFTLTDGRGMQRGMEYIFPYIADKSKWPLPPDVMYWEQWPVRQPSLLFAGLAYGQKGYISVWEKLAPWPETEEGLRNFPIRQPVLWLE